MRCHTKPAKGNEMLKGKHAVITGSTSGIGMAIARGLAAEGANVVINGFGDADAIEKERAGIEKEFGVKAFYINADLMQSGATRGFIDESVEALGGIDILVNNAGIQHRSEAHTTELQSLKRIS